MNLLAKHDRSLSAEALWQALPTPGCHETRYPRLDLVPYQLRQDLAGFWERHYPAVRRELMRKYPKHSWSENASPPPLSKRH